MAGVPEAQNHGYNARTRFLTELEERQVLTASLELHELEGGDLPLPEFQGGPRVC